MKKGIVAVVLILGMVFGSAFAVPASSFSGKQDKVSEENAPEINKGFAEEKAKYKDRSDIGSIDIRSMEEFPVTVIDRGDYYEVQNIVLESYAPETQKMTIQYGPAALCIRKDAEILAYGNSMTAEEVYEQNKTFLVDIPLEQYGICLLTPLMETEFDDDGFVIKLYGVLYG